MRITNEDDFIAIKRFNYSLKELLAYYEGREIPDRVIAQALLISEPEVEELYAKVVLKLQRALRTT